MGSWYMLALSSMELEIAKVTVLTAWGRGKLGAVGRASGVITSFGGRDGMQGWSTSADACDRTGIC